jgi:hypothetical protein
MVSPAANRRKARGNSRERRNCSHWTGMSPSPPTSNEKMRAGASAKSSRNEHEGSGRVCKVGVWWKKDGHASATHLRHRVLPEQASAAPRYRRDGGGIGSPCHARAYSSRASRGDTPSHYRLYTVTA